MQKQQKRGITGKAALVGVSPVMHKMRAIGSVREFIPGSPRLSMDEQGMRELREEVEKLKQLISYDCFRQRADRAGAVSITTMREVTLIKNISERLDQFDIDFERASNGRKYNR
jgi:hypothetical protein